MSNHTHYGSETANDDDAPNGWTYETGNVPTPQPDGSTYYAEYVQSPHQTVNRISSVHVQRETSDPFNALIGSASIDPRDSRIGEMTATGRRLGLITPKDESDTHIISDVQGLAKLMSQVMKVEREWECPICTSTEHPPKVLVPCGHSFCENCCDRKMHNKKCPICKIEFHISIPNYALGQYDVRSKASSVVESKNSFVSKLMAVRETYQTFWFERAQKFLDIIKVTLDKYTDIKNHDGSNIIWVPIEQKHLYYELLGFKDTDVLTDTAINIRIKKLIDVSCFIASPIKPLMARIETSHPRKMEIKDNGDTWAFGIRVL